MIPRIRLCFISSIADDQVAGFTIDVVARIIRNTALNPALTLPLFLLAHYTRKGRQLSVNHEIALQRLKYLLYIGIARLVNAFLSRGVQNNWTSSKYDWNREVAVVTGGSDGLGKNIALLLAEKGVKVASLDIQPPTYEPRLNIQHHTCDITSPSSVQEVATSIRSTLGNPTLLINNAGIGTGLPILDSTDEINRRVFDVNVLSHFRLVREFLPAMITANHGTVVTIASVAACVSAPSLVDYSSSKSAALSFHEGLAAELKTLYEAPKVKLTDKFVVPMLRVETVAEKVVEKIMSGNSGVIVIPEAANWVAWSARALPMWWQVFLRTESGRPIKGLRGLKEVKEAMKSGVNLKSE
ncbi:dehydrogenase RED2 [Physcia stellaris]|nr:dehydrogenase RED2 [Physcia stellaris]